MSEVAASRVYPEQWRAASMFGSPGRRMAFWLVVVRVCGLGDRRPRRRLGARAQGLSARARHLRPDGAAAGRRQVGDPAQGMTESVQMAIAASIVGMVLAIPLGLCAARNLAPRPIYLAARGTIVVGRTFHEVLIAIFFVKLFGFGPVAGLLTLAFSSAIFLAKMLAEDIENMQTGPRRSGARHRRALRTGRVLRRHAAGDRHARWACSSTGSTRTCATPPWWVSSARAASARRCRRRFRVTTTTSPARSCSRSRDGRVRRVVQRLGARQDPMSPLGRKVAPGGLARHSPREKLVQWLWLAGTAFAAVWSVSALDIEWAFMKDAHVQAADLVGRMWPPEWSYLPRDRRAAHRHDPHRHARHDHRDRAGDAGGVPGGAQHYRERLHLGDRARRFWWGRARSTR